MKKMYLILGVILVLLIVSLLPLWNKAVKNSSINNQMQTSSPSYTIKHYQNHTEPKFSFDYPEFSGWHSQIENNEIRYIPDAALGIKMAYPPTIIIKPMIIDCLFDYKTILNPNGVPYGPRSKPASGKAPSIIFFLKDQYVEITIPKDETYPNFSGQIIWDTIINSFSQ